METGMETRLENGFPQKKKKKEGKKKVSDVSDEQHIIKTINLPPCIQYARARQQLSRTPVSAFPQRLRLAQTLAIKNKELGVAKPAG